MRESTTTSGPGGLENVQKLGLLITFTCILTNTYTIRPVNDPKTLIFIRVYTFFGSFQIFIFSIFLDFSCVKVLLCVDLQ